MVWLNHATVLLVDVFKLIILPYPLQCLSIRLSEYTRTRFRVLQKLSLVNPSVMIQKNSVTVDHIVAPIASVNIAIGPIVFTVALNFILGELSNINVPGLKSVFAFSFLDSLFKLSFVLDSFGPFLNSMTFLQIVLPHSFIAYSVQTNKLSRAMGVVALPISSINISVLMHKNSFSITLISEPFSKVKRAILPELYPKTFPQPSTILPYVNNIIIISDWSKVWQVSHRNTDISGIIKNTHILYLFKFPQELIGNFLDNFSFLRKMLWSSIIILHLFQQHLQQILIREGLILFLS